MSVDAILKEIAALTDAERAELLGRLAEQFSPDATAIAPELAAELDRRDAAYDANPSQVYSWEEVVEYVKRKK